MENTTRSTVNPAAAENSQGKSCCWSSRFNSPKPANTEGGDSKLNEGSCNWSWRHCGGFKKSHCDTEGKSDTDAGRRSHCYRATNWKCGNRNADKSDKENPFL